MAMRMPYPDLAKAPPHVQELLAARLPLNIYKMLAHAPTLMPGWLDLGGGILHRSALDANLRQLAILRTAHLCRCSYMIFQHRKISGALGLPADKVDGTEREPDAKLYDAREMLALRMTTEIVRNVKAADELFAATLAELGQQKTMELMMTIGFYMMAARVMENTGLELEEGGGPAADRISQFYQDKAKSR